MAVLTLSRGSTTTLAAAAVLAVTSATTALFVLYRNLQKRRHEPIRDERGLLLLRGLPFLGVAIDYAQQSGVFARRLHDRYQESVFAWNLMSDRWNIIVDPRDAYHVWKMPQDLSFNIITRKFANAISGVPVPVNEEMEKALVRVDHDRLLHSSSEASRRFLEYARDHMVYAFDEPEKVVNLYDYLAGFVFAAGLDAHIGTNLDGEIVIPDLIAFDDGFTFLAGEVDPRFSKECAKAAAARDHMADYLKREMESGRSEPRPWIKDRFELFKRANYPDARIWRDVVLLVWAKSANTFPLFFWLVAHVLTDPELKALLVAEVDACYAAHENWLEQTVSGEIKDGLDFLSSNLPNLHSSLKEAMRMYGNTHSLRVATDDLFLQLPSGPDKLVEVRKGEFVVFSTSVAHKSKDIFGDNADEFHYDRFLGEPVFRVQGEKLAKPPLFPFGGGVSMCPGRRIAEASALMTMALALRRFNFELRCDGLPEVDGQRVSLGVQLPKRHQPMMVAVSKRRD